VNSKIRSSGPRLILKTPAGSVACADDRQKRVMDGGGHLRTELRYKDGQRRLGQCENRYTKAYKECQELSKTRAGSRGIGKP